LEAAGHIACSAWTSSTARPWTGAEKLRTGTLTQGFHALKKAIDETAVIAAFPGVRRRLGSLNGRRGLGDGRGSLSGRSASRRRRLSLRERGKSLPCHRPGIAIELAVGR